MHAPMHRCQSIFIHKIIFIPKFFNILYKTSIRFDSTFFSPLNIFVHNRRTRQKYWYEQTARNNIDVQRKSGRENNKKKLKIRIVRGRGEKTSDILFSLTRFSLTGHFVNECIFNVNCCFSHTISSFYFYYV